MATLRLITTRELGMRLIGSRFASGGSTSAPKASAPAAAKVPEVSSPYYPEVTKSGDPSEYNGPDFYMYNEYSYYDLEEDMMKLRMEAPSTAQKYTSFKAPVSQK